jgi:uncharacterized coiled-coil protein SlyX
MSDLDDAVNTLEHGMLPWIDIDLRRSTGRSARAELAAMYATVEANTDRIKGLEGAIMLQAQCITEDGDTIAQLRATIAQQAELIATLEQEVSEARDLFRAGEWNEDWCNRVDAFLLAHPAPVCPECSSEVLQTKYCMMGHWCGVSCIPVIGRRRGQNSMNDKESLVVIWAAINCKISAVDIMHAIERRIGRESLIEKYATYLAEPNDEDAIKDDLQALGKSV